MPFVGRVAELRQLDTSLDAALNGSGRLLLAAGDAGMGKSALVSRFADRVRARGGAVVVGRCLEISGRQAYQPWLDVQGELMRRGWLPQDAPLLSPDPQSFREALFDDVVRTLHVLAEEHDLVLVIEDLHLAGLETALLLEALARRLPASRLLAVATYRPVEARFLPELADVIERLPADRIDLPPLVDEEVRALLGEAGLPVDGSAPVLRRTAGNPLFVSTAIRLLRSGTTDLEAVAIPAGIRQAVRRQVQVAAATHPDVPQLLEAVSVVW